MSTTTGPFTIALNQLITCDDPNAANGTQSAAVQVQNTSEFVLTVLAAGETYTIPSFQASTLPLSGSGGGNILITATQDISGNSVATTFTLVWLLNLAGQVENPPIPDGPLTSAALAAILAALQVQTPQVEMFDQQIGVTAGSLNVPIPKNTNAILIGYTPTGNTLDQIFQVIGTQTGITYDQRWLGANFGIVAGPNNTTSGYIIPINSEADQDLTFSWTLSSKPMHCFVAALLGPVPSSEPPEAVAIVASVSNPGTNTPILGAQSSGLAYEISAISLSNGTTPSNITSVTISNGATIFCGVAFLDTINFNPPIVVGQLLVANSTYSGTPAGVCQVSAAYRYHT